MDIVHIYVLMHSDDIYLFFALKSTFWLLYTNCKVGQVSTMVSILAHVLLQVSLYGFAPYGQFS